MSLARRVRNRRGRGIEFFSGWRGIVPKVGFSGRISSPITNIGGWGREREGRDGREGSEWREEREREGREERIEAEEPALQNSNRREGKGHIPSPKNGRKPHEKNLSVCKIDVLLHVT